MARVSRGATSTNGRRIASSQIDDPCQRWAPVALPVVAEYTTGPGVTCRSTRYMLEKLALRGSLKKATWSSDVVGGGWCKF